MPRMLTALVLAATLIFEAAPPALAAPLSIADATSFASGADPYRAEYAHRFPGQRYPQELGRAPGSFLFDNFRVAPSQNPQNGGYAWTSALVDATRVEGVYFMMCTFRTKVGTLTREVGHGQLLYLLAPDGAVTPQGAVPDLISSFEAFRDEGVSFDAIQGLGGAFDCGFVLSSALDGFERAARFCTRVYLYELLLDGPEAASLLSAALVAALDKDDLQAQRYHTFDNTCSGNQWRLLNEVLPPERRLTGHDRFPYKVLFNTSYKEPGRHLGRHGLVGATIPLNSREEISAFIADGLTTLRRTSRFGELHGTR